MRSIWRNDYCAERGDELKDWTQMRRVIQVGRRPNEACVMERVCVEGEGYSCLLEMPAVLQIALLNIFKCVVVVHFVSNTRFKHAKNHTLQMCVVALTRLKRQGLRWMGLH